MSRASPCIGGRPCSLAKFRMSSNPAMTRSSFGERPPLRLASTVTPSASSSSSSSISATIGLSGPLQECDAFRHPSLPCVLRSDQRQASALLLELQGAFRQVARLFDRHRDLPPRNDLVDLSQRLLA